MDDDRGLIHHIQAGDEEALDRLLRRHRSAVYAQAMSYVQDPDQAEDLTQEVLERVCEALRRSGTREYRFVPWLQVVVRNACISALRKGRKGGEAVCLSPALCETQAGGQDPLDALLVEERAAEVRAAFARLPADQRELLWRFYVDGQPQKQIAAAQGKSPAAVAMALVRARRAFAQAFSQMDDKT